MSAGPTKPISGKWIVVPLVVVTVVTLTTFLIIKLSGRGAATRNYLALHQTAGLRDLEQGFYEDAVKNFTPVIEAGAEPSAFGFRGEAYLRMEQYDRAIADFREAVKQEPDLAANHAALGAALAATGSEEEALVEFEKAIALHELKEPPKARISRTGDNLADVIERRDALLETMPERDTAKALAGETQNTRGSGD